MVYIYFEDLTEEKQEELMLIFGNDINRDIPIAQFDERQGLEVGGKIDG